MHLVFYRIRFVFDTARIMPMGNCRTNLLTESARQSGILAVVLMLIRTAWATIILVNNKTERKTFYVELSG